MSESRSIKPRGMVAVKTMFAGLTCVLLVVAAPGCGKPERSEVARSPEDAQGGPSQTDTSEDQQGDDLTPDELANLLMGDRKPRAKPQPVPEGKFALGPKLLMTVPEGWVRKEPRVGIIEHEFAVPAAQGDQQDGRVTVTAAGGTVEANIQRWYGQFTQPDGSKTSDKAKTEEQEIAGHKVHLVDISGTFFEPRGGPFAQVPPTERPGYRMLSAIVETPAGLCFVKFYGPQKTVAAGVAAFRAMIEGLKAR